MAKKMMNTAYPASMHSRATFDPPGKHGMGFEWHFACRPIVACCYKLCAKSLGRKLSFSPLSVVEDLLTDNADIGLTRHLSFLA